MVYIAIQIYRRYMTQYKISKTLALRVQRNAQHALTEAQRTLPESAVELIAMVSRKGLNSMI